MITLAWIAGSTALGVFGLAVFLMLIRRLGAPGLALSGRLACAPYLDVVVALFTIVPWVPGAWFGSWLGFLSAIVGQLVGLGAWVILHEWIYRKDVAGPRIVKVINRAVGRWRNHAALWVTAVVLPVFWLIRLAQVTMYPLLVLLLNFPRYKQAEWVNCSRHKFEGLVGHDLIWCLYCDWMTGVYSLGAEMLRNVESFWCPIRFYDSKKCENCRIDFPDIDNGWAKPSTSMADVETLMKTMYGDGPGGRREWFGHPARTAPPPQTTGVTIEGQPPSS